MSKKTYEVTAMFRVFARCWVTAETEEEAKGKIQMGGGYIQDIEFDKHTAEFEDLESIQVQPEEEE